MSVMNNWYYLNNQEWIGPFDEIKMRSLFISNVINKDTLVVSKGNDSGDPLSKAIPWASRDLTESPPHPWRRYLARALDESIIITIICFLVYILLAPSEPVTMFLTLFLGCCIGYLLFCPIINALLIGYTGSSIGKEILGVKILDSNYNTIGFQMAIKREWLVMLRGEALYCPSISWMAQNIAYYNIYRYGTTSWDRDLNLKILYKADGIKQDVAMVFVSSLQLLFLTMIFVSIYFWAQRNLGLFQ